MSEKRQNVYIGAVIALGIILGMAIVLFIKPHVGDGRKQLRVWFVNIDKISKGTPVTLAGKSIGEVAEIHSITQAREQKVDALGRVYYYELRLRVDSNAQIYTTDAIFIQTSGLLGERNIAIIPKHIPNRKDAHLADENSPLCAQSSNSVEEAVAEISQTVVQAQAAVRELAQLLRDNQTNATQALTGIASASSSIDAFVTQLNERDFANQFTLSLQSLRKLSDQTRIIARELSSDETLDAVRDALKHTRRVLAALDDPTRWKNILKGGEETFELLKAFANKLANHEASMAEILSSARSAVDKSGGIVQNWHELTDGVKMGRGTLGQLLTSNGLYSQADALLSKSNRLITDINSYGLLFQNNREWKRARALRHATAEQLQSPEAFQTYCNAQLKDLRAEGARIEALWLAAQSQPTPQNRNALLGELNRLVKHLAQIQSDLGAMAEGAEK